MKKQPSPRTYAAEWHLNAKLLPVLVVLFAGLYLATGFRGWLVFLIGAGGAWLLAYVWMHTLSRGLSLERRVHFAWARAGDSVPEELIVRNAGFLPAVWLELRDEAEGLADPLRLVTDVEAHGSRRRHPIHQFHRRGLYRLGPTRLQTGDPFGIYTLTLHDPHTSTLLITPPQLALNRLSIAPGGWAGDRQRRRQFLQREISEAGVREYLPGDSLRRIHWRASAHLDRLVVRQLEAAASGDWWIFVDLDESAQAGHGQDSTLELSVVLAASLASRGLRERRRVGLALAGPDLVWLEPRPGPAQRWQVLRALAMAGPGRRSLAQLLALAPPVQTAALIVITPSVEPGWVAVARRNLRGGKLTVLLVDPRDFGGRTGQERVAQALARSGLPSVRMPGALLAEAYSAGAQAGRESVRRYLEKGTAAWQSMD